MRNDQHTWDLKNFPGKHKPPCLNRHISKYAATNTCSHRGQAYLAAVADGGYVGLTPASWDIGKPGNYMSKSSKPFWHEAHHIVPNSELREAIADVGDGTDAPMMLTKLIRGGLLDEDYNLNGKANMIILPMVPKASRVLKLPRHRRTRAHRSHRKYSNHVKEKLDAIFAGMKPKSKKCKDKKLKYKACKRRILLLSTRLRGMIKAAGPIALDDILKRSLSAVFS